MLAWNRNDTEDKQFVRVLGYDAYGNLVEIPMENIEIGKRAILQLADGQIVCTSPVQEWSVYGHCSIYTKNREYYRI